MISQLKNLINLDKINAHLKFKSIWSNFGFCHFRLGSLFFYLKSCRNYEYFSFISFDTKHSLTEYEKKSKIKTVLFFIAQKKNRLS